jgi:hypothetical protein
MNAKQTIHKLEAAQRQLCVAIALWFHDGDDIAVHTLSAAAHQIIHDINRDRGGRDLLFDSIIIKDEFRKEWLACIKSSVNFFKHADRDPDESIEFTPASSLGFIIFSVLGLELLGVSKKPEEDVFMKWLFIQNPRYLTEKGRRQYAEILNSADIERLRLTPKKEFFELYLFARNQMSSLNSNIHSPELFARFEAFRNNVFLNSISAPPLGFTANP